MSNTPIIFIDIDGPLIPNNQWFFGENSKLLEEYNRKIGPEFFRNWEIKKRIKFNPFCVWCFNIWAKYAGAMGVISSSWWMHSSREQLEELFKLNGLNIELHPDTATPRRMSSYRCNEIRWWLDDNPTNTYLIVDDMYSLEPRHLRNIGSPFAELADHVVYVNENDGLTRKDFELGCKILNLDVNTIFKNEFGAK